MTTKSANLLAEILKDEEPILKSWLQQQAIATASRPSLVSDAELRRESVEFLKSVRRAVENGRGVNYGSANPAGPLPSPAPNFCPDFQPTGRVPAGPPERAAARRESGLDARAPFWTRPWRRGAA